MGYTRRKSTHSSLKNGSTASSRRLLSGVSNTTSDPSSPTADGWVVPDCDDIVLISNVAGTAPIFTIIVWGYSKVSETWSALHSMNLRSGKYQIPIPVFGADRIAVSVSAVSGSSISLSLWAAAVVPA